MNQQNKKLTIGIFPETMAPIRKFKSLIELETGKVFSLGHAVYLASVVCSKILNGETTTKKDIINLSAELNKG